MEPAPPDETTRRAAHRPMKRASANLKTDEIMTPASLARYLRCHKGTIYRLLKNKKIPAFRIGSDWRFSLSAIDEWVARRETTNPPEDANFANVIRERRRQLDLTQEDIARRINTSVPYIAHLEAAKRHPSEKVVVKLANALRLDPRELFFLANPATRVLISEQPQFSGVSAWDAFVRDEKLRKIHNITDQEMVALSKVAMVGDVRSPHDFVFILNSIRQALGL
jgi:excisionase family DNA binding protein